MKRILVATDFSPHATRAAEHAVALAELFGASVELLTSGIVAIGGLHVRGPTAPGDRTQELLDEIERSQQELAERIRQRGIATSRALAIEEPSQAICARAADTRADLVALGTRGRTGMAHVVFGSVAERTARLAPCPVLTVHMESPAPAPTRTILVPSDFSRHADAALGWAEGLRAVSGARIVLLHVSSAAGRWSPAVVQRNLEERAERIAGGAAEVRATRHAHTDMAILEAARECGADLVVMGTRGLTGLEHVMLGSTAERVIRRSDVPVVSLKDPGAVGGG